MSTPRHVLSRLFTGNPFLPVPWPLATIDLLPIDIVLPSQKCHINGIIHLIFCVSLLSRSSSIMSLRLTHVVVCISNSFLLLLSGIPLCDMLHLFISSSVDGDVSFSSFGVLWIRLLWTFLYQTLCMFYICFNLSWINLWVEFLGHTVHRIDV